MHCFQKTVHFLSVSNGPTSISSDIVISLRKSNEIIFVGNFWKITNTCKRCFWDVSGKSRNRRLFWDMLETSSRHYTKHIFFEMFLRCFFLKTWQRKRSFLRSIWDVLKTSQKSRLFWDVSKRSLRCLCQWRSHASWEDSAVKYTGSNL